MKVLIVALFCLSAAFAAGVDEWLSFKGRFGKSYGAEEERMRIGIFYQNIQKIAFHNQLFRSGKVSYSLGLNQFTDMTPFEVKLLMNGYRGFSNTNGSAYLYDESVELPTTVDWRTKGLVTGVKNQGQCGSCWAFSTTGSLEGQHKKKTGKLISLSEQNLMDCSHPEGNMGCEGGLMDQAFSYIKKNHGIDSEASYPYKAVDERCRYRKKYDSATVTGFVDIPSGNEKALQNAVATVGPISVAIDANHTEFFQYKSGILNVPSCSSTLLDHGVLAVGYGTENGQDYWLVKNRFNCGLLAPTSHFQILCHPNLKTRAASQQLVTFMYRQNIGKLAHWTADWGESWGIDGYVKMARNKDNQCGIATQASYPLV